jgi:ABC-type nitrate/sulfonate/bicarbonate transport system substrate-binding protein
LDVEFLDPDPGPENVHAVAAGRYDLCVTSVAHFLRAKADDPELGARFVFMVARRPHLSAFVRADGTIRDLADLGGASVIASPDSGLAREYSDLLARLGLAPGPFVAARRTFHALAAAEGEVGLEFLEMLPRYEAAAAKLGVGVRALPFYESGLDVYGSGVVAGTRLIESRPAAVGRIVRAVHDALVATRSDPWPGAEALRERYRGVAPERAVAGFRAGEPLVFFDDDLGAMDAASWERTIDYHARVHGTPRIAPEQAFDAVFASARA